MGAGIRVEHILHPHHHTAAATTGRKGAARGAGAGVQAASEGHMSHGAGAGDSGGKGAAGPRVTAAGAPLRRQTDDGLSSGARVRVGAGRRPCMDVGVGVRQVQGFCIGGGDLSQPAHLTRMRTQAHRPPPPHPCAEACSRKSACTCLRTSAYRHVPAQGHQARTACAAPALPSDAVACLEAMSAVSLSRSVCMGARCVFERVLHA